MKKKIGIPDVKTGKSSIESFELWILFDHARSAVSRAREIELANFGLTIEQGAILYDLISKKGSATLSELAESTVRQYHSVTTLINRMTKSGLVKKIKSSDNKKFQVSITDRGLNMYQKVTRNSIEMTFSVLSSAERENLSRYLQKLTIKARNLLGLDYKHPFLS